MKNGQSLRIALVFDDTLDSSDGVAQYVKTLGAWLSSRGHHVGYLVGETKLSEWQGGKVYSLAKNIKVVFNGNRLSMPLPSRSRRIKRVLEKENFDVIHVMVPYSPFMAGRVIRRAAAGTAIVGTFHIFPSGWLSAAGARLLGIAQFWTLRRFGSIVSVSPAAAGFAKRAFRIDSQVVPNAVELKRFKVGRHSGDRDKAKTIVFLGRLVDRKGAAYIIRAFAKLTDKHARLVIAGDGSQRRQLESLAAKLGLGNRVEFLGYIDESAKPALLAGADVACFPSLYGESFGIVLIEAMAAGAGVVLAGDNPGYRSVLSGQPKLLINPRDTDGFAARLDELLGDATVSSRLHAWQEKSVKQYDVEIVGRRLLEIYSGQIARLDKKSHNKAHG